MKNLKIKNNDSLYRKGRESQSGRSMIEMLGVLAIIGVLSVGGIAGYSKAMMKYKINKTIEQVSQISQNIRTFFDPQKVLSGLTNAVIKKAKLVPDEVINGSKYQGSFGEMYISGMTQGPYPQKSFEIGFYQVPQEACIELVTLDWSNVSSGFVGLTVNVQTKGYGDNCWHHSNTCNDGVETGRYSEAHVGGSIGIPVPLDIAIRMCSINDAFIGFLFK